MPKSELINLLEKLIACPSITPQDAGCQKILSDQLTKIGFQVEHLPFGQVQNLWATYGSGSPTFIFAGHTDVVPTGEESDWLHPPFQPVIKNAYLYGRGACDMKSAIAAMVTAVKQFISDAPHFKGKLAFLITSDEEGEAKNGTQAVIKVLKKRGEIFDYCIVGEPSSDKKVGDQIRMGRRGSLHGKLIIHGKQGHVAHPHLAVNPVHRSLEALHQISTKEWDQGNADFPPTTFQITNIKAGTGAANVVPGHLELLFNFRFSTAITIEMLKNQTEKILQSTGLAYHLDWSVGGEPFLTPRKKLLTSTTMAIQKICGMVPKLSTGGGTSDGRFIAKTGAEVVELGVSFQTAHQVNESVLLEDVKKLSRIYHQILLNLLS